MAQKFGGIFSPSETTSPAPAAKEFKSGRASLLFMAPLPLLATGFASLSTGSISGIIGHYGSFVVLIMAAWLLRDGLKAEAAFNARKTARRPAFPRKVFASVLTGLGIGMIAWTSMPIISAVLLALFGGALHSFSFGLDPMKNKGIEGFDEFANERVATAIEAAEEQVQLMTSAIGRTDNLKLQARVQSFADTARDMFRTVEDDPRDLSSSRKYLGIYLRGAAEATVKFADLYQSRKNPTQQAAYEALLDDLETNFKTRQKQLLLDDQTDLDIDIDVLRERLQAEGVTTEHKEQ